MRRLLRVRGGVKHAAARLLLAALIAPGRGVHAAALHAEVRGAASKGALEGLVGKEVLGAQGQAGGEGVVAADGGLAKRGATLPHPDVRAHRGELRVVTSRVLRGVSSGLRPRFLVRQRDELHLRVSLTERTC